MKDPLLKLIFCFAWQYLVIWCAPMVCWPFQSIDSVKVSVKDPAICERIGEPVVKDGCRMIGSAVGNFDKTWTVTSFTPDVVTLEHFKPGFFMYSPADWHFYGGTFAAVTLAVIGGLLMLLPAIILYKQEFKSLWGFALRAVK